MSDFLELYLAVKAVHVIAVIAWMAGILYMPQLLAYHADAGVLSAQSDTFKIMERRLLKAIMNPAMVVSWATGIWLSWRVFDSASGWLQAKIVVVILLSLAHAYLRSAVGKSSVYSDQYSAEHWRAIGWFEVGLLIAATILVVVKPF